MIGRACNSLHAEGSPPPAAYEVRWDNPSRERIAIIPYQRPMAIPPGVFNNRVGAVELRSRTTRLIYDLTIVAPAYLINLPFPHYNTGIKHFLSGHGQQFVEHKPLLVVTGENRG